MHDGYSIGIRSQSARVFFLQPNGHALSLQMTQQWQHLWTACQRLTITDTSGLKLKHRANTCSTGASLFLLQNSQKKSYYHRSSKTNSKSYPLERAQSWVEHILTLPCSMYRDSWPSLFISPPGMVSNLHIDTFGSHFWMSLFEVNWCVLHGHLMNLS